MFSNVINELKSHLLGKVEDFDILIKSDKNFSVKVFHQEIDNFTYADSRGLGLRVVKNGKTGYAFSEDLSSDSLKIIAGDAVSNAEIIEKIEDVSIENHPDVDVDLTLYSTEIDETPIEDKINIAKNLEKIAYETDPRVVNVNYALYGDTTSYIKIANSKGMEKEYTKNYAFCYVGVIVEEKGEKRSYFEFDTTRDVKKLDAAKLASTCVKEALALLGQNSVEPGSYPMVFTAEAMSSLLGTFFDLFSAKSVQEGKSLLGGKMNSLVANPCVTLLDDALDKLGNASRPFDGEGFPSQKTVLIQNGILLSFLHNTNTAKKDNLKSTGNAYRDYKSNLDIAYSNLKLEPGDCSREKLFEQHDVIIEIVNMQGLHSGANSISGDFSLSAEGFIYEKGKNIGSLRPFTISGNFLSLLQDITMIASDFKYSSSFIGCASCLVKSLNLSI